MSMDQILNFLLIYSSNTAFYLFHAFCALMLKQYLPELCAPNFANGFGAIWARVGAGVLFSALTLVCLQEHCCFSRCVGKFFKKHLWLWLGLTCFWLEWFDLEWSSLLTHRHYLLCTAWRGEPTKPKVLRMHPTSQFDIGLNLKSIISCFIPYNAYISFKSYVQGIPPSRLGWPWKRHRIQVTIVKFAQNSLSFNLSASRQSVESLVRACCPLDLLCTTCAILNMEIFQVGDSIWKP